MNGNDERAPKSYLSVCGAGNLETIVEKSRFIAYFSPISHEEHAKAFIDQVRAEHMTASHVVYAWIIGAGGAHMRASDDGEPQGTAGVPTLEVLKKENITDVVCATVRYFGGVKLGAGGLVRAYTRAASDALKEIGTCQWVLCQNLQLTVDYPLSGAVSYYLTQKKFKHTIRYDQQVHYQLPIELSEKDKFVANMIDLTNDKARFIWQDLNYQPTNA